MSSGLIKIFINLSAGYGKVAEMLLMSHIFFCFLIRQFSLWPLFNNGRHGLSRRSNATPRGRLSIVTDDAEVVPP